MPIKIEVFMLNPVFYRMHIHNPFKFVLAFFVFLAATSLHGQVQPPVSTGGSALSVGSAFALYNANLGRNRLDGVTVWADWQPGFLPQVLHGLGLEVEGRDLSIANSSGPPAVSRMDTAGGGPVYTLYRYRNFRPYAKFILSYGSIDWNNPDPFFKHETRTVYAPGGGFEQRVYRRFWFRADYEYQAWAKISGYTIDPQGFSFGVSYHLNRQAAAE